MGINKGNTISIMGRLSESPKLRQTNNGFSIVEFKVFTEYDDNGGQHHSDRFSIKCLGKTAEFADKYLSIGKKVCISGSMQEKYYKGKDKDGSLDYEVIADEIEFVESKTAEANYRKEHPELNGEPEIDADGFYHSDSETPDDLPFS